MPKQFYAALLLCIPAVVTAGGPLVLEGPNGRTPARYQDPAIVLNYDNGPLGASYTKAEADLLVNEALVIWNAITTSSTELGQGADVPVDVNADNFTSYIPVPGSATVHNDEDGLNPVVYDSDGSIIDAFFGAGQGTGTDATVVGFAASSIIVGTSFFTEGFAVINGNDNLGITRSQLKLVIAHEIGHFIGLDHSQADIDNTETLDPFLPRAPASCSTAPPDDYPLMYPYACRENQLFVHPDDNVAVSTLYPAADFFQNQAQLTGRFVTTNDAAVRGANLWLENGDGQVYSIVSDYLTQCNGFFALMLPPGDYVLHANSINAEFWGGSSVGPYADQPDSPSFLPPASDIGADLLFRPEGNLPAIITLEAGKSVDITFRTDGSGSMTASDTQVPLTDIYNSASSCVTSGGDGGGGSPGLPLLAALAFIPAFRNRDRTFDQAPRTQERF